MVDERKPCKYKTEGLPNIILLFITFNNRYNKTERNLKKWNI